MVEGATLDIHKGLVRVEKVNAVFSHTRFHNTGIRGNEVKELSKWINYFFNAVLMSFWKVQLLEPASS